jgi:hypothetical protein
MNWSKHKISLFWETKKKPKKKKKNNLAKYYVGLARKLHPKF